MQPGYVRIIGINELIYHCPLHSNAGQGEGWVWLRKPLTEHPIVRAGRGARRDPELGAPPLWGQKPHFSVPRPLWVSPRMLVWVSSCKPPRNAGARSHAGEKQEILKSKQRRKKKKINNVGFQVFVSPVFKTSGILCVEQNIPAVGAQPHCGHHTGLCSNLSFPSVLGVKVWSSKSSGAA